MPQNRENLAIIGSTGSIGTQTLEVVRAFPGRFQVIALAAGQNIALLRRQVEEFKPRYVACDSKKHAEQWGLEFVSAEQMAALPEADVIVVAAPGGAGLRPTLAAVGAGKRLALANKESLVMAGELVMAEAKQSGAMILPVDSEHSAIWQCLAGETSKPVELILTASGGPFRSKTLAEMSRVTAEEALNHPSWRMGRKVTIDSATLMNKGLEVIEAHWLYDMPYEQIRVIIHPQSVIHSMVEFADGAIKAQLSWPDMRLPIQYALTYPERLGNAQLPRLGWDRLSSLDFEQLDFERFPCLGLAIQAGTRGGTYPAALSGADEAAVNLFLAGRIRFTDIAQLVGRVLDEHQSQTLCIASITAAEAQAKERVLELYGEMR